MDILKKVLIFLILGISSLSLGVRSYYSESVSDDILYQYVLDDKPLESSRDYDKKVQNLEDAIYSQSHQYFTSNGRFIVHVWVQMFAGVWGRTAYSVTISFIFFAILILFVYYTLSQNKRINPLYWICAAIAFLYLFPNWGRNWILICMGFNYLYPMLLILGYLIILRYSLRKSLNIYLLILFIFYSFVAGWSQEAFSLPMSGGLFIYLICNFRKIKLQTWILSIVFWIGTAVLVFAPGNFNRFNAGDSHIVLFLRGIEYLYSTVLFDLLIILLIGIRIWNKSEFKRIIKLNRLEIYILLIAVLFGLVANSLPQSFSGIAFYSLILIFKFIGAIDIKTKLSNKISPVISILLLVLLSLNQIRIIAATKKLSLSYRDMISQYQLSEGGIVKAPEISLPADVILYVNNWYTNPSKGWLEKTLTVEYGKNGERLNWLSTKDYENYKYPYASKSDNKDSYVLGDDYIWFNKDRVQYGDTIVISTKGNIDEINPRSIIQLAKWKITKEIPNIIIITDSINSIEGASRIGVSSKIKDIKDIHIKKAAQSK